MRITFGASMVAALAAGSVFAGGHGIYGDLPDAKHAWSVHDRNRPNPVKVESAKEIGQPPSDAVVLFDGTKESLDRNWSDASGKPTKWIYDAEERSFGLRLKTDKGWSTGAGPIFTKAAFGDCQLHIEFKHPADLKGTDQMRGNSGVFLMGNYEIQVMESYLTNPADMKEPNYADGQCGAVYAENPPLVNANRKAGEWQVYDIVFHQPIWNGQTLLHPGSVTVFLNGVLIQDHWEMEGLTTHCHRRPLAPHPTTGRLQLQDHGCPLSFRNVWYRPLASRWDNLTHSAMSADPDKVMALRRETAAKLYADLAKPLEPTIPNVMAMAEVISYAKEGEYAKTWKSLAEAFHGVLDKMTDDELNAKKDELLRLRNQLDTLIKAGVVPQNCGTRIRINAASLRLKWEKL